MISYPRMFKHYEHFMKFRGRLHPDLPVYSKYKHQVIKHHAVRGLFPQTQNHFGNGTMVKSTSVSKCT
ncbi:MAG TPA: hypothetical protein VE956_07520 [Nodularia sp. (in: cyanobacteria)]|nr:hypothetical protein [Nodularia sp. (in: cyanobacteria)]